ncbi:sarcoplasmic calcium-binding proteins I, III, and IV-like [Tubulanus polymorphus]|uniref:sarcoplasmic calcium-binding proteins I, III, and IV-like n=1 Tax=Tubulanus polymorphus TaxID=672921 RepID=UPI003DA2C2FA
MAPAALSDYQKKKLAHVFNTFYDYNHDGVIEWKDFQETIEKVCKLHHWELNGSKHKSGLAVLRTVWDGLQLLADKNKDLQVTKEEWFTMWSECLDQYRKNQTLPDWQTNYMNFFFEVTDTSGDNVIDKEEYTIVYETFGLSKDACHNAFKVISDNGGKLVTREEFKNLWIQFSVSDNPSDRGNSLFGVL